MAKQNLIVRIDKGDVSVVEKPYPNLKEGFVIVKQHIAPVCGASTRTDHIQWYTSPDTMGHEGVGEVCDLGPGVSGFTEGDRVIIYQGWACGECWVCQQGLGATHCINLKGLTEIEEYNESQSGGGGFSQYRLAPANMLQHIPDDLEYKYAAAANCFIGCTYSAMEDLHIGPGHYCLLTGVGPVGMYTIVNIKYRGGKVIVLGRTPHRMHQAKTFGADIIINPEDDDWQDQVRDFTPQCRGADFAFECSGYPYYMQRALDGLRHYGTLVLLAYQAHIPVPGNNWSIDTERDILWPHRHITGSFDVNFKDRQGLVETLQDPWIQQQIDRLVTHQVPFSQAKDVFEIMMAKEALKVYLLPFGE